MGLASEQNRTSVRLNFFRTGVARCPHDKALLVVRRIDHQEQRQPDLSASCPICGADFSSQPELPVEKGRRTVTTDMRRRIHNDYWTGAVARCPFDDARLDILSANGSIRRASCPICGTSFL